MTSFSRISTFAAFVMATATLASASTISLGSYASTASNPGFANQALLVAPNRADTYTLSPGTTWSAPLSVNGIQSTWVGVNPGDGFNQGVPANYEPNGEYVYHSYFTVTDTAYLYGTLTALADDTLDVYLNGHHVIYNSLATGGSFATCSDTAPTCTTPTTGLLLNSYFVSGVNDLEFDVYQANSYQTGLDFVGVVATPEPSSLVLLGSGLLGTAGALLRRMKR